MLSTKMQQLEHNSSITSARNLKSKTKQIISAQIKTRFITQMLAYKAEWNLHLSTLSVTENY